MPKHPALSRFDHRPRPLYSAEAEISRNDVLLPHGIALEGKPEALHFSKQLDVVVWNPTSVSD
jgi:hypothetical protein